MTLNEFFLKFLPNFQLRLMKAKSKQHEWTAEQEAKWVANNYDEALQNFVDRICQKQREYCGIFASSFDVIREDIDIESAIIEHSLQPEITEL